MPSSHSENEEIREYWVRVRHFEPSEHEWQVLVPIQLWHAVQIGVASQNELTGPAACDMNFFCSKADKSAWTFQEAQQYCEDELTKFKEEGTGKTTRSHRGLLSTVLDNLADLRVRKAITIPNVKSLQRVNGNVELDIPDERMEEILEGASKDVASYLLMYEFGFHCMNNRTFDYQPSHFQRWFQSEIGGENSKPGRTPKNFNLKSRNLIIYTLIDNLTRHGLTATRNETSDPVSACDAVAKAAVKVKLFGAKSYESVRKIYDREKATAKSAPSVALRK